MKTQRRLLACLVLVLLGGVGLLLGRTPALGQQPLKEIIMAYLPIGDFLPMYVAIDQGYFAEAGIKITLKDTPGGGGVNQGTAVASDSAQMGAFSTNNVIAGAIQGFDFQVIAEASVGLARKSKATALVVPVDSPLKSAKDLEGKTLGTANAGAIMTMMTYGWMIDNGADWKKLKLFEVPFPRMAAPLKQKQVDAIAQVEPFVTLYQDQMKIGRVLGYLTGDTDRTWSIAVYFGREKWIEANPELVKSFIRAYDKGVDFTQQQEMAARAVLPKFTRIEAPLAQKINLTSWGKGVRLNLLEGMQNFMHELKFVDKKMDMRKLVSRYAVVN